MLFAAALITALVVARSTRDHLRAASLLVRASGGTGWLADLYDTPITVENVLLSSPHGTFRARIYRPRHGRPSAGLILAHGVHYMGIDEPRLIPFARQLARTGLVVMTPELAALADYRVENSSVDELRAAARDLSRRSFVRPGGVGLMGLSFAGGLSLLAASDASMRGVVNRVVVIGGHNDLHRVSRFLATDELETPAGVRHMHAHDYGLIVYFYAHAEQFVDADQLPVFRDALRLMLHLDRATAERAAASLDAPSRALFDQIDRNEKRALAPLVLRTLANVRAEMAAVSPAGHLDAIRDIPVFILHGANDDVMPPTEPAANARELESHTEVHLLITPAIKHVTFEAAAGWRERLRILHTMAGMLAS
jgi:dienelactone hydrolase